MSSLENAASLLTKLVNCVSCPFCKKIYDENKLAICGHRICILCCKRKKKCPTCKEDVDQDYLQEDKRMKKIFEAVKNNLEKFQHVQKSNEVKHGINNSVQGVKIEKWLNSSQNHFSVPPTPTQNVQLLPIVDQEMANKDQHAIKRTGQDDFDKIECIEDTQPLFTKDKENVVGPFDIETYEINDTEHTKEEVPIQRRNRKKSPSIKLIQSAKTQLKDVIAEVHHTSKANHTISEATSASDKTSSNPKNWINVKKMKKEFSKVNKRDVKKLNVSIEMCKKTHNVFSKSNKDTVECVEIPHFIEDDTPHLPSPARLVHHENAELIKLDSQTPKHNAEQLQNVDTIESAKHKFNTSDQRNENTEKIKSQSFSLSEQIFPGLENAKPISGTGAFGEEKKSMNDFLSQVMTSKPNSKPSEDNMNPSNMNDESSKIKNNPGYVQAEMCQVSNKGEENPQSQKRQRKVVNARCGKRMFRNRHSTEKFHLKQRSANRNQTFKRIYIRKIGLLNITTPEGNYIITGENVCIRKVPCSEKSTQTEANKENMCDENKGFHTETEEFLPSVELLGRRPNETTDPKSSSATNPTTSFTKPSHGTEKTLKTNTASRDTATAPSKIIDDIDKELTPNMERVEESDIFNTCSGGNKPHNLPAETHSEVIGDTMKVSLSSTQRSKRQQSNMEEPATKKAKGDNDDINRQNIELHETQNVLQPQLQNHLSPFIQATPQDSNNFMPDFDEITSKAFAQIDADLHEHKKNKSEAVKSQETGHQHHEFVSDAIDIDDNVLNIHTPRSTQVTQHKAIDIDCDDIEDTPQKEKSAMKRAYTRNTQSTEKSKNALSATSDTGPLHPSLPDVPSQIQNVESPLPFTFCHGITNESTPLRTVPRRSLNFNKFNSQNESERNDDSLSCLNNSGTSDVTKTSLEKEIMEMAFERTPHAPTNRPLSSRKEMNAREERYVQVACSCLTPDQKTEVYKIARKLKWEFVESYTPRLTHLVVETEDNKAHRTCKFVSALAAGKWIVSFEWISECIKNKRMVDEAPYEVLDMAGNKGPQLSRLSKTKLFKGMIFYCHPPFSVLTQRDLEDILRTAGGKTTNRIEDVSLDKNKSQVAIVVAEPQSTLNDEYMLLAIGKNVVPVNFEWVLNCLGSYSLEALMLLCPPTLIPVDQLSWPQILFDNDDST